MARKKAEKAVVTIRDIARDAGVSPSTVSRALAGSTTVDAALRAAVEASVKRLNYRPNPAAQGLVRGRSKTIGVLTQNMTSLFYAEMVVGIEQRLFRTGYFPLFASGNWNLPNFPDEQEALDVLLDRRVDALLVLGGQLPDERLREVAEKIPVIAIGRRIAGLEQRCLMVDNYQGAYQAVEYMIRSGHTRIAHIAGIMSQPDAVARFAGYRQALADAGIEHNEHLIVEGTFQEQGGIAAVEMLLARGVAFSAIFAANDPMAYGARLALFRRGLRVPQDISLIGFDDQLSSVYTIPPLTTVRQPAFDMGVTAADNILKLLAGQQIELPLISSELVIRESTQALR
jgi:LacI family transcriptional regulator